MGLINTKYSKGIDPYDDAIVFKMDSDTLEDQSWFREFIESIFSSPDLDYSQFIQLESKKTRARSY